LFNKYGTDKVRYAGAYELLLRDRRRAIRGLLEVGIGTLVPDVPSSMVGYSQPHYRPGGSLRAWRDYLPFSTVVGLDVQEDTQFEGEERIVTCLCDSTNASRVETTLSRVAVRGFDVVIDDGSHDGADQVATFANLYPHLAPGGLYFIEDVYQGRSALYERPSLLQAVCGSDPYCTLCYEEGWHVVVVGKPAMTGSFFNGL
jgi:hypothetical protein